MCPGKCELAENPQFRWRGGADVIDCHAALVEEERERCERQGNRLRPPCGVHVTRDWPAVHCVRAVLNRQQEPALKNEWPWMSRLS